MNKKALSLLMRARMQPNDRTNLSLSPIPLTNAMSQMQQQQNSLQNGSPGDGNSAPSDSGNSERKFKSVRTLMHSAISMNKTEVLDDVLNNFSEGISHVYYETEYRIEWCHTNSTSVPCFLFARKFSQGAAMRLLSQEVVNHFEVSALHILQTSNGITTSFNRHTPHKDFDGIIIQHTAYKQILKTKIGQVAADRML